ncbi:heptaprenyl diphosphate synthase component 1 [Microaerobacter geothermalis]|uniref:heptaprenyl diphosphate synthase component 1 n=1 Tax=Microaerobacter geothermalis TaxID=674972 RepID=UPI001F239489|nr:heptaprenyl diphosphate synthase component 1 [Microaerobacter geothermalis]MCF6095335.1 heptaprenyl diphosphate synthase component 1 [Microaerobacter geothermalis]
MILKNSSYKNEMNEILKLIRRNSAHHYLEEYINPPSIFEIRLELLFLFLQQMQLSVEKIRKYCTTVMLVQMGLDIHEEVGLERENTHRGIRSRQLKVLAGDYFSSQYYFLLSEIEDIEMIHILAEAIKEINENKTRYYLCRGDLTLSPDKYLSLLVKKETPLYTILPRRHLQIGQLPWEKLMNHLILVEILLSEREKIEWGDEIPFGFGMLSMIKQLGQVEAKKIADGSATHTNVIFKHKIKMILDKKVEELLIDCQNEVRKIEPPLIKNELINMIDFFFSKIEENKLLAEEI